MRVGKKKTPPTKPRSLHMLSEPQRQDLVPRTAYRAWVCMRAAPCRLALSRSPLMASTLRTMAAQTNPIAACRVVWTRRGIPRRAARVRPPQPAPSRLLLCPSRQLHPCRRPSLLHNFFFRFVLVALYPLAPYGWLLLLLLLLLFLCLFAASNRIFFLFFFLSFCFAWCSRRSHGPIKTRPYSPPLPALALHPACRRRSAHLILSTRSPWYRVAKKKK